MKRRNFICSALLIATAVSCTKEIDFNKAGDNNNGIRIFATVEQPSTKVTYTDNIHGEFNPHADPAENNITMAWREGDELVAVRWQGHYDEYSVLKARESSSEARDHEMVFADDANQHHFKEGAQIVEGERFILIHGDFVLDPDARHDYRSPKIDFPTSQVSKEGYMGFIHHGGVVENIQSGDSSEDGNPEAVVANLTFRDQDGTLENLRKHEYMVADAYVHIFEDGSIHLCGGLTEDGKGDPSQPVIMHSAHTLVRLTLFIPDEDFGLSEDTNLYAISLKEKNLKPIFHRYFRMEPNEPNTGANYYHTSYNDNPDKENNCYFRLNLGTSGWPHTTTNVLNTDSFDPTRLVSYSKTHNGKTGHFVTAYISVPSKHIGGEDDPNPSQLVASIFTRTHFFRTVKTYSFPDEAMKPGYVIPLNINFAYNEGDPNKPVKVKAITDPHLGMTFSPGIVYAHRASEQDDWQYSVFMNQGEYGGIEQQSGVFGDYFCYGSLNPVGVFHKHGSEICPTHTNYVNNRPVADLTKSNDVAEKVTVDNLTDIFTSMSKKEAERVWAKMEEEAKSGINRGYYYYEPHIEDDGTHNTAHQAVGAHKNLPAGDARRNMSSTLGVWIGTNSQPSLAKQDHYIFIPSSNQLSNSTSSMTTYTNADGISYFASADYKNQSAQHREPKDEAEIAKAIADGYIEIPSGSGHYYLKTDLDKDPSGFTIKFSTNTRDYKSAGMCYRFQVWYKSGKTFTSSGIKEMDMTFGRVVRPVIY